MISQEKIEELVRLKGNTLFHREGQELEFKEQFNLSALADYFRDFAAFSNNRGGYLIFGIKDKPRIRIGLTDKSREQFEKIDPERISDYLLKIFSTNIRWEMALTSIEGFDIAAFLIYEADVKPVIATKNEGKDQTIKDGEVYFRYGGRTQKIQSAELENIISKRVEQNNQVWIDLMSKIGKAGPENAAILDTERALIEKDDTKILVLDDELANKLKFIKEGKFVEKDGASTLKLVGDVVPIDKVEVIKRVQENLTKVYPLSATELADQVRKQLPSVNRNSVWSVIRQNDIKNNRDYSAYVFRNRKQEEEYLKGGPLPSVPSIYNMSAVSLIVKVLEDERINP